MLSKNAEFLLRERYCREGEEPKQVYERVANFLFSENLSMADKLYTAMSGGVFLPNSPCIYNAGVPKTTLSACFVLPIEDSIGGIFKTVSNMAAVFHYGGGVGINFSPLREEGAKLRTGGTSSGVVSFMKIFDSVTETVKQGGYRRGALMGLLNADHAEIYNFITAKLKGSLTNFNISLLVTDDFMSKIDTNKKITLKSSLGGVIAEVRAKDIFDLLCFSAWSNGDPGLVFYDTIKKDNTLYPEVDIVGTNPCGEQPLPPYGSCCLGSINLSKMVYKNEFNFDKFIDTIKLGSKTLEAVNNKNWYPIPEIEETMNKLKPQGLGVMGFADCLIKLGIYYDSQECLDFIDKIGTVFKETTEAELPDFHFYRRSIAPTGSLAILADCSNSIEPVYDETFTKSLTIGKIEEVRDLYKSEFMRKTHEVSPEWHVQVQARWQKYIDSGVSKTCNLPSTASVDDVKMIYKRAWESGCKGITIFRDGSKGEQVFNSNTTKTPKCSDETCIL